MSKDLASLPKGWKVLKLSDISKGIQSGGTPLRNQKSFYEGSIPWVKTLDLNEGVVNCTEEKINEEGFKSIRGKLRPINTVMVAMYGGSGTVGKTGILGISAATNQAVCCIEPNPKVFDSVYLHFYLIGVRKEWMRYAIGTRKDPNISKGIIQSTEITLPPLEEQRAIATTLRTIQTAKEARQKELALERERKAALMDYLFTHGTRNEPRKQTKLGEIPESWNTSKLSDTYEIRYGLGQPPELDSNGIPIIRATDIKRGRIISEGVIRVKREAIPLSRNPYLKQGDILVVRSGAYTGDIAMYDGRWDAAIAGYDLVASPISQNINSQFIANYLLGEKVQSYFKSQSDRSAQAHINADQLRSTPIPLPTLQEQQEIADILSNCDAKIATLEREINLHDELFRAMLEELMTGQISSLPLAN